MFEWRDIIYISMVASVESVSERWQLQQKRRSNEVTGVRECLTELEWNLHQVCAMWQECEQTTLSADQWKLQNNAAVTSFHRDEKQQIDLLEEKCRTAETDIWSQGISSVQKQMGWVIIWMVLMVFLADHNLNLMFSVTHGSNNLDFCCYTWSCDQYL